MRECPPNDSRDRKDELLKPDQMQRKFKLVFPSCLISPTPFTKNKCSDPACNMYESIKGYVQFLFFVVGFQSSVFRQLCTIKKVSIQRFVCFWLATRGSCIPPAVRLTAACFIWCLFWNLIHATLCASEGRQRLTDSDAHESRQSWTEWDWHRGTCTDIVTVCRGWLGVCCEQKLPDFPESPLLLLFPLTNTSSHTEERHDADRRADAEQTSHLLEITHAEATAMRMQKLTENVKSRAFESHKRTKNLQKSVYRTAEKHSKFLL